MEVPLVKSKWKIKIESYFVAFLGNLNFNKNDIIWREIWLQPKPLHRGAFCQFTFRWIHYYDSNKSTGLETGKLHLCGIIWMKFTVDKYLHMYTVLQKISLLPVKVMGFEISLLVGCPKLAVQKLFLENQWLEIDSRK